MKNRSTIWLFVFMVFIVPAMVFAGWQFYEKKYQALPVIGGTLEVNGKKTVHTIADFHLQNQDEVFISTKDWENKIVVANFFFTHCPVICPSMTKNLVRVQQETKPRLVTITSFSIDPERDNAAALKKYSSRYGINNQNWNLLTGDKKIIYKLARESFRVVATDGDGGPNDFIHSEKLVLIDRKKRIRGYYTGTDAKEVNQLIYDIKKLENEKD